MSARAQPSPQRPERRLAAILAADVVGYSRLMGQDEAGTLEALKAIRRSIIDPKITEHGGRIVKTTGDGLLVEFPSVVEAVQCAVEVQQGVAEANAGVPEERRIRFRIGINLGDVIHEDGDVFGDGVNVAARLESLSDPGGICLSGGAHDAVRGRVPLAFEDLGWKRVKNIAEPLRVYRVRLGGSKAKLWPQVQRRRGPMLAAALIVLALVLAVGAWRFWPSEPALAARPSIAVLPFEDLGGDARQARLADAFTEDLITELARVRYLQVVARNSAEAFHAEGVDVRQVGRQLGVSYVLEGSLEVDPQRIRVTAQLIDAENGTHLWADRYDRPADDLFAVRDEILRRLVGTLTGYDGPIWTEWIGAAQRRRPDNLNAFDYVLLSREPYRRHDPEGNAEARRLLEQAIELDPDLARAWQALAHTHFHDALNGWTGDRARSWEKFHETAERAAELDPADANIQLVLGMSYFAKDEFGLGLAAWDRALALGPNDAKVHRAIGAQLPIAAGVERAAEGVALVERALSELDPLHPPYHWMSLGIPLYFAGRFAEAAAALEKVPEPWLEVRVMLALSYAQAGLEDEARAQAGEVLKLDPGFSAEAWVDNDFYQPGGSSAMLFIEGARKAGLPLCATAAQAATLDPRNRLPECDAQRA